MSLRDNPNVIEEISDIRRDLDELSSSLETGDLANFVEAEDITSTSALTPPVQTNMIADGAVTVGKTNFAATDLSSQVVWDSGMSTSSVNDRKVKLKKTGNLVILEYLVGARSNYQLTTSWADFCTLPVGARPTDEVTGPLTANNRDTGAPTGYGKFTIGSNGLIRVRTSTTISNAQALFGGISWFVQ